MKLGRITLAIAVAVGLLSLTILMLDGQNHTAQAQKPDPPEATRDTAMQTGNSTWIIERVDAPRDWTNMTDRSLALDSSGYPHIAYGEDNLYHAWYDG
ncbi:MAG: hypothetical protein GY832_38605, partial [Chloroflexi bacterium]|nr:hypothetical protein [Chloroflexota bacterium]